MSETTDGATEITFPDWASFLFEPHRYKVAYGGRGSSKSWSVARALLVLGGKGKKRILCAREFQVSIGESVHRLLSEQIEAMGLEWFYTIQQNSIFGLNGTEFIFAGIRNNPTKIKSTEGVDICWVEEAEKVSNSSWDVLIPTIRKPGSEIWVTFNPADVNDPTYKRFVLSQPPDCISRLVNWRDNPWFTEELKNEMEHLRSIDIDAYNHIWEGECAVHSQAQVFYGKWAIESFTPDENWDGPYFGVDWGFAQDPTVMTKSWVHDNKLYIEEEALGTATEIDRLVELFMQVKDSHKYTVRADSSRPETIEYMVRHGYPQMCAARKWPGSVEDGLGRMRSFDKIIAHPKCKHTQDELRLYSYKVDRLSGDIMPDVLDKHNHCIDSIRYAIGPIIENTARLGGKNRLKKSNVSYMHNYSANGWMG